MIGGVFWSYFQTPSTRQATYAPFIIIGFGMSVMYVMSMAFVTELIGDNKVCDLEKYCKANFEQVCSVAYIMSSFRKNVLCFVTSNSAACV